MAAPYKKWVPATAVSGAMFSATVSAALRHTYSRALFESVRAKQRELGMQLRIVRHRYVCLYKSDMGQMHGVLFESNPCFEAAFQKRKKKEAATKERTIGLCKGLHILYTYIRYNKNGYNGSEVCCLGCTLLLEFIWCFGFSAFFHCAFLPAGRCAVYTLESIWEFWFRVYKAPFISSFYYFLVFIIFLLAGGRMGGPQFCCGTDWFWIRFEFHSFWLLLKWC